MTLGLLSIRPFVCPSFYLPRSFLGICPLVFSETQRNVYGAHLGLCFTESDFWGENSLWAKITKNDVLGLFCRIGLLDLVEIGANKVLMLLQLFGRTRLKCFCPIRL